LHSTTAAIVAAAFVDVDRAGMAAALLQCQLHAVAHVLRPRRAHLQLVLLQDLPLLHMDI
jgi:hypothetical protein